MTRPTKIALILTLLLALVKAISKSNHVVQGGIQNIEDKDDSVDVDLFSRQLYVLGKDAQERFAKSTVLIVGLSAVGMEIAKVKLLHTEYFETRLKLTIFNNVESDFERDISSSTLRPRASLCRRSFC